MMSKFPDPVHLPPNVQLARKQRNRQVVQAAKIGIGIRLAIILLELFGVYYTNSSAIFLDALSSLTDVISTVFLILCMKLAQKPPDSDHPFGHGRYEPLGGLLLGLLLLTLGGIMLIQQIFGVAQNNFVGGMHPFAWVFPFVAFVLLEVCYRCVMHTAKKENSTALLADAVHYRVDSITSLLAMGALMIAASLPEWSQLIDKLGASCIALFMVFLGIYAARENFNQIMDRVPAERFFVTVREAAKRVFGVKGTEKIRIQTYGPDAHVDIDVEVDPQLSVDEAHKISQEVRAEIQKNWPAVRDVTVHIEPFYAGDH